MVHLTRKQNDLSFVADIVRRQELDPKPIDGFHSMPGAWDESARYKRVVERYSWGQIVFLSNRTDNEHITAVLVGGELDLATGEVKEADGKTSALDVSWYKTLAREFDGVAPVSAMNVPACLGYHERDATCDGGFNAQGQMERPCAWREFCIPFQAHAVAEGELPAKLAQKLGHHKLVQLVAKLKDDAPPPQPPAPAIAPVNVGSAAKALTKPVPSAQRLDSKAQRGRTGSAPAGEGPAQDRKLDRVTRPGSRHMRLFAELWTGLQVRFPDRAFHGAAADAKCGEFYQLDRAVGSRYINVCCQGEKRRAVGIFQFRIRSAFCGVQLPIPHDHELLKPLGDMVVKWKDGHYLSEVKPLPDGVTVPEVLDIIEDAVRLGLIELPEMEKGS